MLLVVFLLLSIPKELFGIDCIYRDESFEQSLDDFNYENFTMTINEFPSYDYKDDNIEMCRVEIYIDYKLRLLIISFGDSFQWSKPLLDDGEAHLDFLITLNQNNIEPEIYNVLEYACNNKNQCNKLFVFNQIHWLKQVNYTDFETHLKSSLFKNSNQTENCYTDKINLSKCPSGVCLGKYSNAYKNYLFECHPNSETSVEVHITTSMIIEGHFLDGINLQENQIIRYTCKFNQCNNQFLTDSLVTIVEKYFPLSSMRKALIATYQQIDFLSLNSTDRITFQTTTQPFSSSKFTSSEYVPFNLANNSFHISINLIFLLLFILFDI